MKRQTLILTALLFLTGLSFAQKQFDYQVECVSVENSESVSIRIWNTKLGKKYAPEQARKDAILAILFSGVPGNNGCIAQNPMLSNNDETEKFNKIKDNFFSKKGNWANCTREATIETTKPESIGDKSWKVYQVSVSKNILRKYLEEYKIIKSLNTGF
ncbi:MAG: hypothetical protein WCH34_09310 [Bacteroidota bacterium]